MAGQFVKRCFQGVKTMLLGPSLPKEAGHDETKNIRFRNKLSVA